MTQDSR